MLRELVLVLSTATGSTVSAEHSAMARPAPALDGASDRGVVFCSRFFVGLGTLGGAMASLEPTVLS